MTKSEVIKEFFKKSVLPVAVAALLYCIFKSACTKDGVTDYVWLFILCGLPFGIPRMFAWIVPGGSLGTALPLFLLNFIIGGVIGGFVLVWRLLVAAWYIPLTIYRLFITRGTSYIPEYGHAFPAPGFAGRTPHRTVCRCGRCGSPRSGRRTEK